MHYYVPDITLKVDRIINQVAFSVMQVSSLSKQVVEMPLVQDDRWKLAKLRPKKSGIYIILTHPFTEGNISAMLFNKENGRY